MSNNKRVRNRGTQINKKKSLVIFVIVLLAAIIGIAMASSSPFLKSTSSTNFPHNQQEQQPASYPITQKLSDPSIYTAPPLGSSAAKVTLIEFGDYQCTYCHRFHIDTKGSILTNFVNTGKVKFLFKDFPINDLPADRYQRWLQRHLTVLLTKVNIGNIMTSYITTGKEKILDGLQKIV
jgi:hypothetical protein